MRVAGILESLSKRLALATVRRRGNRFAAPVDAESVRRVLIYRPQRFGDMLATLPILRALKAERPGWHLTLWTGKQGVELLGPERIVDALVLCSGRAFDRLRARGTAPFDLVLDLVAHDSVNALVVSTHAARRGLLAGFGKDRFAPYYDWARPYPSRDLYALDAGMRVLDLVGLSDVRPRHGLTFSHSEMEWADRLLQDGAQPIVVNLSSGYPWSIPEWRRLIDLLAQRTDADILLSALGRDRDMAEALSSGQGDRVRVLPPRATFRQTACLLGRSALLVSPDTSLVHITAPLGIPTVGLYSRRHNFRMSWAPSGDHVRIIRSPVSDRLDGLSADTVYGAVEELRTRRVKREETVE